MKKFLIGMYKEFNEEKFKRDFRDEFYGIEVSMLKSEKEIQKLLKYSAERNFKYGIHFPLREGISPLRDAQFLSKSNDIRENSYRLIENELKFIKENKIKPQYILFHFPKPSIINDDFDLSIWKFSDKSEYIYKMDYSFEEFKKYSEKLFEFLNQKSIQYNFIPVLEFDALNEYILKDNFTENLFIKFNRVKLCLDTGRLHLQTIADKDFDYKKIINVFAKYALVIHLWNIRTLNNTPYNHYPALPSMKSEDGWADIKTYLEMIKNRNKNVLVYFEHNSDLISNKELNECYSFIKSIMC